MSQNINNLINDKNKILNYLQELKSRFNFIEDIYITGSRVWEFGERKRGEYNYRKKPHENSDWDLIIKTKFACKPFTNLCQEEGYYIEAACIHDSEFLENIKNRKTLIKI